MTASVTTWMDAAACRGDLGWLNRSEGRQIATCQDCPVRFECLNYALGNESSDLSLVKFNPVYGGLAGRERAQLIRRSRRKPSEPTEPNPRPPRRLSPIDHGTPAGYKAHLSRGEQSCDQCREAARAYRADRRREVA